MRFRFVGQCVGVCRRGGVIMWVLYAWTCALAGLSAPLVLERAGNLATSGLLCLFSLSSKESQLLRWSPTWARPNLAHLQQQHALSSFQKHDRVLIGHVISHICLDHHYVNTVTGGASAVCMRKELTEGGLGVQFFSAGQSFYLEIFKGYILHLEHNTVHLPVNAKHWFQQTVTGRHYLPIFCHMKPKFHNSRGTRMAAGWINLLINDVIMISHFCSDLLMFSCVCQCTCWILEAVMMRRTHQDHSHAVQMCSASKSRVDALQGS